jgi:hypothetical protein
MLDRLPPELLSLIAFPCAVDDTHRLLTPLTALLSTCRRVNDALRVPRECLPLELIATHDQERDNGGNPGLYSRIFSAGAIRRRSFTPTARQYTQQLIHYLTTLRDITNSVQQNGRRAKKDLQDNLFTILLMLFEDDGNNRAQLERVGVYDYVMGHVLATPSILYLSPEYTGGWPIETIRGSSCLWILWMLTTRGTLMASAHSSSSSLT